MPAVVNTATAMNVDLVTRAKAGDDGAFTALLRPMIPSAYRLAGAMLHDPHAAENVVQDASLKAWRKVDQLKAGAPMQPWFLGIVANECRSARRTRWWSVVRMPVGEVAAITGSTEDAVKSELSRAIGQLRGLLGGETA